MVTAGRRLILAVLWGTGVLTIGRAGVIYAAMFTMAHGVRPVAWGGANLRLSLWYTVPVFAIILAHEGGHWWACRRYQIPTRGPWLLPVPISLAHAVHWLWLPALGLAGAVLRVRGPYPSPLARWDVAWSGLMAGFAVTAICTVVGAWWSVPLAGAHVMGQFWQPGIVRLLTQGRAWHPLMVAGWVGWALTTMSLIPIPPADGGRLYWAPREVWRVRQPHAVGLGLVCLLCWG